jgi:hypothetical protein
LSTDEVESVCEGFLYQIAENERQAPADDEINKHFHAPAPGIRGHCGKRDSNELGPDCDGQKARRSGLINPLTPSIRLAKPSIMLCRSQNSNESLRPAVGRNMTHIEAEAFKEYANRLRLTMAAFEVPSARRKRKEKAGHRANYRTYRDRRKPRKVNICTETKAQGTPSDMIPPISEEPGKLKRPKGIDALLQNHINHGTVAGDLDSVDRTDLSETPVLDTVILGNQDMRPGSGSANVSTSSRPAIRPDRIPHGARSTRDR